MQIPNQVMIDLETMSTEHNAAIISIGAAVFNDRKIVAKFYTPVCLESSVQAGLHMSPSTVVWWAAQSMEAKEVLNSEVLPLWQALQRLGHFLDTYTTPESGIWGNGATFDNVILDSAYKATSLLKPWTHRQDRCYRTLAALYPDIKLERTGTYHNALDDAVSQAEHAIKLLARVNSI